MRFAFVALLLALTACGGPKLTPTGVQGRALATDFGCVNCHSTDGSKSVGPTWKGLSGSQVALDDGTVVNADDTYLRESILEPSAKTVKDFKPGLMETVIRNHSLTEKDVRSLIAYIKELK